MGKKNALESIEEKGSSIKKNELGAVKRWRRR